MLSFIRKIRWRLREENQLLEHPRYSLSEMPYDFEYRSFVGHFEKMSSQCLID